MISACSSLVVQTEVAAWGNQAVAVTFKPQVVSGWDWYSMSVVSMRKFGGDVTERTLPNKKKTKKPKHLFSPQFIFIFINYVEFISS